MNRTVRFFFRPSSFFTCLLCLQTLHALASDGFDNNYFGGDANQLMVTINGQNKVALFGPGDLSTGSFYIPVPNGSSGNLGAINTFNITGAASYLRSAYFDRVLSTVLYYRIYPSASIPPANWSMITLEAQSSLPLSTCYTQTQNNIWQKNQSVDLLVGLSNGSYVLEFYMRSDLYDVGLEPDPCMINANDQCNMLEQHFGRYISSRFNVTDPTACDLANILANQSAPSKIFFQLSNQPLQVWTPADGSATLTIWPNPVVGKTLHFSLPAERGTVYLLQIFSCLGQLAGSTIPVDEKIDFIDTEQLTEGIYSIIASDAQGRVIGVGRFAKLGRH